MISRQGPVKSRSSGVLLVSMPFGPLMQPSIALGLLKASLREVQVDAQCLYLTLDYAKRIGPDLYTRISNGEPSTVTLLGEWIFSAALEGKTRDLDSDYLVDVVESEARTSRGWSQEKERALQGLLRSAILARNAVEAFMDDAVARILATERRLVGFTSVFQQHCASVAMAQRIKSLSPSTLIIMGGANCEGFMGRETQRQFSCVDAVVSGEGERVVQELVPRMLAGQSYQNIANVYSADSSVPTATPVSVPAPVMDELPYPDFDDYREQWLEASISVSGCPTPRLLFETARGCWWGTKQHCTFCGLNGANMSFRSKSADRALAELEHLAARFPGWPISVVDNILDYKYFDTFIPALEQASIGVELFYEVKSNLRKVQVRALAQAGITQIQPGIESFSDQVLRLMGKGVSGLQNVQLLKWCKELGIQPHWNLLWGFPREQPEDYEQMAEVVPSLFHLSPPGSVSALRLDRFSPNFDASERLGFTNVRPYPAYRYVYGLPAEALANLAYFFCFDYAVPQDVAAYTRDLAAVCDEWTEAYLDNDLFQIEVDGQVLIWDLRRDAHQNLYLLDEPLQRCYGACDSIQHLSVLARMLTETVGHEISEVEASRMLEPLVEARLLLRRGKAYLALAIGPGEYEPSREVLQRLEDIVNRIGTVNGDSIELPLSQAQPGSGWVAA